MYMVLCYCEEGLIRQGYMLSPYMFVIYAHGLSKMLEKFEHKKFFKGVSIVTTCPFIFHMLFFFLCVCVQMTVCFFAGPNLVNVPN